MHILPMLLLPLLVYFLQVVFVAGNQMPLQTPQNRSYHFSILDDEFAKWIRETGETWGMKGMAIAVTRKNKDGKGWTTETKGYGVANRWGYPVNEQSQFPIASNSKLFTALAVGMLTSNRSVSVRWDSKIKDILPHSAWALQDKIAEKHANLVDILSHRTGLPRHGFSYGEGETVESSVAKLRYLRPSAEFREIHQYNNQMYILASHIVSRLSATPFAEYVTRNIIAPLGLSSTTYNISIAEKSGKLVDGFVNTGKDEEKGEGRGKHRFRPIRLSIGWGGDLTAGAGGVISSIQDLTTWLQTLLQFGQSPVTGDIIVPAAVVARVAQGVTVSLPMAMFPELSPQVYGMGQERYTYQGHELIEHSGAVPGYHSLLSRSPDNDLAVAVLTNWDFGAAFMQIVRFKILERALGLKEVDWNERLHEILDEQTNTNNKKKTASSLPAVAPTLPYHDLAGIYFNPAYGALSFCAYPPRFSHSSRHECDNLIAGARSSLGPLLNESVPTLLASSQKIGRPYIILRHFSGDYFNDSIAHVFPAPFPTASRSDDDSRPFAVEQRRQQQAQVIYRKALSNGAAVDGMAWKGVWGAGQGVPSPKGDGREGAEVWFDRVA